MFKSIRGRMFWTYAVLLLFLFSTSAVSISALFAQLNERKEIESISSVAHNIDDWTVALQVEQQDDVSIRAY